eukprot:Phypoly_transcript_01350.p1 GENE.Phypoly_transcript_01350~~Phypoly_transcript_01350.p1  ORF type:complete len:585 (+),score=54.75 Phypoly_transcript_01350:279-2033(+)
MHNYSEALKNEPNNAGLIAKRIAVYQKLQLYQLAVEDAARGLDLFKKDDPTIYATKIIMCTNIAQLGEIQQAKSLLADITDEITARELRTQFEKPLCDLARHIEMMEECVKDLEFVLPQEEDDDFTKAGHKFMAEKNYLKASQEFTKAIRKNPKKLELYLYRGEAYLHIPNHAQLAVIDTMEIDQPLRPLFEANLLKLRARALIMLRDFSEFTIKTLTTAILRNPKDRSLPNLLLSVCRKAVTIPLRSTLIEDSFGHEHTTIITVPIIKSYSVEEEEDFFRQLNSQNSLIEITHIPTMGRGVIAKQDIKQGQVIATERPRIAVDVREDVCQNCFKKLHKPQVICPGCEEEWYCSEACRDESWNQYHKGICHKGASAVRRWVRESSVSSSGKCVLLALRYMGLIKSSDSWQPLRENTDFIGVPDVPDLRFLGNSHENFCTALDSMNFCYEALRGAMGMTERDPYFNFEWYCYIANKIALNSWTCGSTIEFTNCKGTASTMYKSISFFNHSCVPNAKMVQFVPTGVLKATKNIKKGEQISYPTEQISRKQSPFMVLNANVSCVKQKGRFLIFYFILRPTRKHSVLN